MQKLIKVLKDILTGNSTFINLITFDPGKYVLAILQKQAFFNLLSDYVDR